MNADTLRFVDRYMGRPLCFLLAALRAVSRLFTPGTQPATPRKVLVFLLSEMGCTILSYPALHELKRTFPDIELFFLVFARSRPIVEELRLAPESHIFVIDDTSLADLITSSINVLARLRETSVDTTIDLEFFSQCTAIFSYLVCRKNRVGYIASETERLGRKSLLTHPVLYTDDVHTSESFLSLVRTLSVPGHAVPPGGTEAVLPPYTPSDEALAEVCMKLKDHEIDRASEAVRLVLVNPNSSDIFPLRKWPIEYFAELCTRLINDLPDVRIIITGTESEKGDAEYILRQVDSKRCLSWMGKTTLPELLALYSQASLMVTNDSGPGHFAALAALPTIALFGPETPRLYSPLNENCTCLWANLHCSPCVNPYNAKKSSCTDNRCMKALPVDLVYDEAIKKLQDQKARRHLQDPGKMQQESRVQ